MDFFTAEQFKEAANIVKQRTQQQPKVGIVLGSGLGAFARSVEDADVIPYGEVPNWPVSTVEGHSGELYVGQLEGQSVMVMGGRTHFYEGYPISQITLPIRVMQLLGVKTLILTNAAGGLEPTFTPGDLMLISDHINFVGLGGYNPLRGPNDEDLGPRFPDMSNAYDAELRSIAANVAREEGIPMHQGVYACVAGPSFETPAEIRFLRMAGASAVGMSTAHETIVARHGGIRVLGISGITNTAVDQLVEDSGTKPTHEEVLEAGKTIVPRLETVLRGVLRNLPTV